MTDFELPWSLWWCWLGLWRFFFLQLKTHFSLAFLNTLRTSWHWAFFLRIWRFHIRSLKNWYKFLFDVFEFRGRHSACSQMRPHHLSVPPRHQCAIRYSTKNDGQSVAARSLIVIIDRKDYVCQLHPQFFPRSSGFFLVSISGITKPS